MTEKGNSMATKQQIAANRRNARQSTGPKTPAGKAASSMNALRHGLRARTVVLWDECQEDFDEIFNNLQNLYQPQNAAEQLLVEQAAIAQWKLVRAEVYEARMSEEHPSAAARCAIFIKMTMATSRLDRAYNKAYEELERIRAERSKPPEPPHDPPPGKPSKGKKSEEDERRDLDVFFVDTETGERQYLYRRRDGKDIPREESPTPTHNAEQMTVLPAGSPGRRAACTRQL
jgi:hypothetical protein